MQYLMHKLQAIFYIESALLCGCVGLINTGSSKHGHLASVDTSFLHNSGIGLHTKYATVGL